MERYPALPEALHRLLEAGPWQGTPSQLYAALEPYRQEPWPANPQALGMWLKHHAPHFGIEAEAWHDGTQRVVRLTRASNNLAPSGEGVDNATYRTVFASWPALLEQALPELVQSAAPGELYTLAVQATPDLRLARTLEARFLLEAVSEWRNRYPSPLGLWLVPGARSLGEWSPPG